MITGITIGRWDLLLPGHITFLEECRRRCDRLIVGVWNDDIKPAVYSASMRVQILQGLKSVDHAIIISSKHPGLLHNLYDSYKFTWFFEAEAKRVHPDAEALERDTPARVVYMPRYSSHTRHQVLERAAEVLKLQGSVERDLAGIIADKAVEIAPHFEPVKYRSVDEVRSMAEHEHPAVAELADMGLSVTLQKPGHGPKCPCDACLAEHQPEFFAKRVPIEEVRAMGGAEGRAPMVRVGEWDFDAPQLWVGFRNGEWAQTSARKFDPVADQAIADEMRARGLEVRLMDRDDAHSASGGEVAKHPYMCDCGWSGEQLVVEGCPVCKRDDQLTYVAQL